MKKSSRVVAILGILGACGGAKQKNPNSSNKIKVNNSVTFDSSREIRVYKGSEFLKVAVVPISGHAYANFILEVQGSDGVADGLVWPVNIDKPSGQSVDKAYATMNRGESRWLMWHETSSYGGSQWKLTLPADKEGVGWTRWGDEQRVSLDLELGKTINADAIVLRFKNQSGDGTLAIRTEWNRKRRESRIEKDLSTKTEEVNNRCGTKLSSNVDWTSIDDETLKKISVTSYCGDGLEGIVRVCKENENVSELLEGTETFKCQFAEDHGMSKKNGELIWKPSGTNHDKLATSSLQQILGYNLQVAKSKSGLIMIMDLNGEEPKFYYCLLYTSPSPRDATLSRMPSSA